MNEDTFNIMVIWRYIATTPQPNNIARIHLM